MCQAGRRGEEVEMSLELSKRPLERNLCTRSIRSKGVLACRVYLLLNVFWKTRARERVYEGAGASVSLTPLTQRTGVGGEAAGSSAPPSSSSAQGGSPSALSPSPLQKMPQNTTSTSRYNYPSLLHLVLRDTEVELFAQMQKAFSLIELSSTVQGVSRLHLSTPLSISNSHEATCPLGSPSLRD